MPKLTLFALTLTAILAFSAVSAYRTTIITTTTTTTDNNIYNTPLDGLDNRRSSQDQCQSPIPMQQLNHCEMHLTQGIISGPMVVNPRIPFQQGQQHLQQCCSQLKSVSQQCQCDAIQRVFDEARQQGGVMEMREMLSKAQRLPTDCRLGVQDCPIRSPRV